ncbi:hypothetical protein [Microbacterium trichothecenolyticum]|uniref:Uncharacterized protein n=1 Tax=Microbacterium trichothecenolyticum TaxID=69370 RepID=A0ABU0TZ76_MICTR|nr:hypothetical protein [Microbacterium trichothecenolyticum]MDQ1124949.1 hypothetical protein [Microbacterium trichothecenolyticum]
MAWTYDSTNAEQGSDVINYWKYRQVRGNLQMRLTDVAIANGERWYSAVYFICVIDRSGRVHGDTSITKTWGQAANYKTIAVVPNLAVRFQIRASVRRSNGIEVYNWWSAQMRWDNTSIS